MSLKDFIQQLRMEEEPDLKHRQRRYPFDGKPKKMALLYILNILREESDVNHPLKKSEILDFLHYNGMDIDRKTAYSNIELLQEEGIISSDGRRRGFYFDDWLFDYSELYFLMEAVESSPLFSRKKKSILTNKIRELGGKYFDYEAPHIIYFKIKEDGLSREKRKGREYNNELFLNISVFKEAINNRKKVTYDYYEYDLDKKLHKSGSYEVSPYELFISNQHYYGKVGDVYQGVLYHRLDYIKNIDIIGKKRDSVTKIVKYNKSDNIKLFSEIPPSKIEGELAAFKFRTDRILISECMEIFGARNTEFTPDKKNSDKIIVTVETNTTAMELWTRRHLDTVEILQPVDFKAKMFNIAKAAFEIY